MKPSTEEAAPKIEHKEDTPAKLSKFERQRIQAKVEQTEDLVLALEEKLESLNVKIQSGLSDPVGIQQLGEEYAYTEAKLQNSMTEWERLNSKLD